MRKLVMIIMTMINCYIIDVSYAGAGPHACNDIGSTGYYEVRVLQIMNGMILFIIKLVL